MLIVINAGWCLLRIEMESSSSSLKSSSSKGLNPPPVHHKPIAQCVVDGCEADLSLFRDYHRRHKVCEPHSKAPKVTIHGKEQRFCQQCSRFHSLAEFDSGKRSCRKRLDGHNRRRRKPPHNSSGLYISSRHSPMTTYLSFANQQMVHHPNASTPLRFNNNESPAADSPSFKGLMDRFHDESSTYSAIAPAVGVSSEGLNLHQLVACDRAFSFLSSPNASLHNVNANDGFNSFHRQNYYSPVFISGPYHGSSSSSSSSCSSSVSSSTLFFPQMFPQGQASSSSSSAEPHHHINTFLWE